MAEQRKEAVLLKDEAQDHGLMPITYPKRINGPSQLISKRCNWIVSSMSHAILKLSYLPHVVVVLLFSLTLAAAQQALPGQDILQPEEILARFVQTETLVREALNQHTFRREVVLQTISGDGSVTGEYIRYSQFLFDDKGNRIERVVFHPPSTIREMRITKEDIQDLAGAQLLGIDIVEATKYRLAYLQQEDLQGRKVYVVSVTPRILPNPHRMSERFFCGHVWIDAQTFQIVKIRGKVEPQGKQRFPVFETWRTPVTAQLHLPSRTEADDILHFPSRNVNYRIRVRYYDYKRFASTVNVIEIDEPGN
jgi:hypothetical protein